LQLIAEVEFRQDVAQGWRIVLQSVADELPARKTAILSGISQRAQVEAALLQLSRRLEVDAVLPDFRSGFVDRK
jgi:hypothetical protein